MKAGIIGFGSIGKRHASNLLKSGINEIILLRELGHGNESNFKEVTTLKKLIFEQPDFIILSNPTALHYQYLKILMSENQNVLVEKPLVYTNEEIKEIHNLSTNYRGIGMVAYNMRFHPCVQKSKEIIDQNQIGNLYSARFFVGQYLPDWRPGTDYQKSYSAKKNLGGGVMMDLIHEIDLALMFCGNSLGNVNSHIGQLGNLNIETEDIAELTYFSENKVIVNVHLDYLTRGYKRDFQLFGSKGWLNADLASNEVHLYQSDKGWSEFSFPNFERNQMYKEMLNNFIRLIKSGSKSLIDFKTGLMACKLINEAKQKNLLSYT